MNLESLPDEAIIAGLQGAVERESESLAAVLEHLSEFRKRRLHERKAYPSLFAYCTGVLGYSESAAGKRGVAARVITDFPRALELVRTRRLHLEGLVMLSPVLKPENAEALHSAAAGKSKREIERIVATIQPEAPALDVIRRLPEVRAENPQSTELTLSAPPGAPESPAPQPPPSSSRPPARIKPISAATHRVAFDAGDRFVLKLESVRALLRAKYPDGDLEGVFDDALDAWLSRHGPDQPMGAQRPSDPSARRVPQWVRKLVWARDEGRCAYRADDGKRCDARWPLELDHVEPWSCGGVSNDPDNIRLLCSTHNKMLGRERFGEPWKSARSRS